MRISRVILFMVLILHGQTVELIVDEEKNMVTTPAYMEAQSIKEVAEGIEKLVAKIL